MDVLFTMLLTLLTAILLAAVVSFAVMATMRLRRSRAAARQAHQLGMRFSAEDPLDVPRRYAESALVSGGHSAKADNVIYGQMRGRRVQAFDFRCEVGHGTRRLTRHYDVVVVEIHGQLPRLLMWNDAAADWAPMEARANDRHVANWSYGGDTELAEELVRVSSKLTAVDPSFQTCGTSLMIFAPARRGRSRSETRLAEAVRIAENIDPPEIEASGDHVP